MLRNWGVQGRPVALAVSLTTLCNWFVTFSFPVIAIGALSFQGGRESTLGPVALAGILITALLIGAIVGILWSPEQANSLGELSATGRNAAADTPAQASRAVGRRRSRALSRRGDRAASPPLARADADDAREPA